MFNPGDFFTKWAFAFRAGNNFFLTNQFPLALLHGQSDWIRVGSLKMLSLFAALGGFFAFWLLGKKLNKPRLGLLISWIWLACPLHLYGIYYGSGFEYSALSLLVLLSAASAELAQRRTLFLLALLCSLFPGLALWPIALALFSKAPRRWKIATAILTPISLAAHLLNEADLNFLLLFGKNFSEIKIHLEAFRDGFFIYKTGGVYFYMAVWRWIAIAASFSFLIFYLHKIKSGKKEICLTTLLNCPAKWLLAIPFLAPCLIAMNFPIPYLALLPWAIVWIGICANGQEIQKKFFPPLVALLTTIFVPLSIKSTEEFKAYYQEVGAHYQRGAMELVKTLKSDPTPIALGIKSSNPWHMHHLKLLKQAAIFYGAPPDAILLNEGALDHSPNWTKNFPHARSFEIEFDEHRWQLNPAK